MKNQQQDSILEHLLAKVANRFLDGLVIIRALFKNAKIIIVALWTRKTVLLARLVVLENA